MGSCELRRVQVLLTYHQRQLFILEYWPAQCFSILVTLSISTRAHHLLSTYYGSGTLTVPHLALTTCVDHNKLWKILKEMGISDHLTCLLRNLYAGQEATVRTGHGTIDWFQIGKGVHQGKHTVMC